MNLAELMQKVKGHRARKRIGRGPGSGHGKTAGRGHKGAHSRSGWKKRFGYAGGQTPITTRFPKRGFNNKWKVQYSIVNVGQLERFDAGTEVTPELLRSVGLVSKPHPVKILGDGELTKKVRVLANRFTKTATEKIREAGGEVVEIQK